MTKIVLIYIVFYLISHLYLYIVNIIQSGNYKQNIEELSGQFEGDIILTVEQEKAIFGKERTGLIELSRRWPENKVIYLLSDVFSTEQADYIRKGLNELEAISCLKFVQRTNEPNFVNVTVGIWFLFFFFFFK